MTAIPAAKLDSQKARARLMLRGVGGMISMGAGPE
jgi:hypothetical protein